MTILPSILGLNFRTLQCFIFHIVVFIDNSNAIGITSEAGIANRSGASEFTPVFSGVCVAQSLAFFVDHCLSFYRLGIALSVLRFTASDYPFGIIKLVFRYSGYRA